MSVPAATLLEAVARAVAAPRGELSPRLRVREGDRQAAVLMLFGPADDDRTGGPADFAPQELDLVLEVRADTLRSHPGEVALPGGGRDPEDNDIVATALREANEEIGLTPEHADVIGTLAETGTVSAFRVTPVVAWRTAPEHYRAMDAAETAEVLRVRVADLLDPARRFTSVYRHPTGTFRGPGFDIGTVPLWGFTAFVLDEFFTAAGWTPEWDRAVERDI